MARRHLGPEPESGAVRPAHCRWKAFISHHQSAGGGFVKVLRLLLEAELQRRGVPLWQMWTDMTETPDEAGMRNGVELSECFILFMTTGMLERHWCRMEIRWALELRKQVLIVYHTDPREKHGNPDFEFYINQIKRAFPSEDDHQWLLKGVAVPYDQRGGHDTVMVSNILKQMPRAQVEPVADILPAAPLATPAVFEQPATKRKREDRVIEALLEEWRLSAYAQMFVAEGYTFESDLLEASKEDLEALMAQMKPAESKRLRRKLEDMVAEL